MFDKNGSSLDAINPKLKKAPDLTRAWAPSHEEGADSPLVTASDGPGFHRMVRLAEAAISRLGGHAQP